MSSITLRQAWHAYETDRNIRPKTRLDYKSKMRCVQDWLDMPIEQINKHMIELRHKEISRRAPQQANYVFKLVRTVINYACVKFEDELDITTNPVKRLSDLRLWNREVPRDRRIPLRKLSTWVDAVLSLESACVRDYLLLLLMTGFRHSEAACLRWEQSRNFPTHGYLDFEARLIKLPCTKNGKPHYLPMSGFLYVLLFERYRERITDYVFPAGRWSNKNKPFDNPYKSIEKVITACGITFSPHDLRRTFLDVAEDVGIDELTQKRLVNHTLSDVTGKHYRAKDPEMLAERLREPMELITQRVLELADLQHTWQTYCESEGIQYENTDIAPMRNRHEEKH